MQIRVSLAGLDGRGFGSGYLVAPRLVLTAAHVLDDMDTTAPGAVTVCRPDTSGQEFTATVRWQRQDESVDAALIEVREGQDWPVPQSLTDVLTRPPQRYGLLIGTRTHPVTLTGFPRLQKDPDSGRRLDEQVTGSITPGTGSLDNRYEILSTDPLPAADTAPNHPSGWSGISGAAVLAGNSLGEDLLCAVVRRDRRASGGTRLTATPAALLLADDDFRTVVTEHSVWEPVLEPLEPANLLTPVAAARDLDSPAALLRADAEAVPFHGRAGELADLQAWCHTGPPSIAIRVLTGPGGQGKTRLARRLTDLLSHQGWVTGHLRSDLTDYDTPPDLTTLNTALPLLLVIDYAETRPRLLRRLITHLHRTRHPARLLLLARSDGEWRTDSLSATRPVSALLAAAPVTALNPLIPGSRPASERQSAFTRAANGLARLLPAVPTVPAHDWQRLATRLQPADDLGDPRFDNALTLQLAALVALLQQGPWPAAVVPGTPAEEILLQHEKRFWEDSAEAPAFKLGLPTTTLAAAVAVASLAGAADQQQAVTVLRTVPVLPGDKAIQTAAWLARLYPADGERYWGSLQPDRLAEYHASHYVTHGTIPLQVLLGVASPEQQAQSVTVLARSAIAHYNGRRTADSDHVLQTLDTALDTVPLTHQALQSAAAALPHPSRITNSLAVRLTTSLTHADKQAAADNPAAHGPALAGSLSNLGIRLSEAGRRAEALAVTQEAVEIYGRLVADSLADSAAAYEPALAGSLSNLGTRLSEAGRRAEALAVTQEAVEIYGRLVADSAAAYEPDLATSLSNFGTRLSEAGRHAEALATEQEALGIRRRLAADNPAAYERDLAGSLSNLGIRLSEAGRHAEALAVTEEALGIRRRLAADNPAAHGPDLAGSLSNLGIWLSEAGRRSEALAVTEEAVGIRRRLAADNPAAYEPALATSLSNLGIRLPEAGRHAEALAVTEEALGIRRRLAADNPAAHEPDLATSLSNLGIQLSVAGRRSEALAVTEEAVEIRRRLAADNPAAHEPDLATSLSNLGNRLPEAGRHAEALAVTQETEEIYRRLAADNPAAHEAALAGSLANLGIRLSEAGRHAEALAVEQEALGIRRRLAADNPAAHEPDLATSLSNLGIQLSEAGRHAEALAVTEEAVEIRRRLAADNPAAHEPDLATSLTIWAVLLATGGDLSGALRAIGDAVESYRRHIAAMPFLLPQLHTVLGLQSQVLDALGRPQDAVVVRNWIEANPLPPDSHN
ncbi:tetratricopeptide repeat protein [Streptacidiphilus sp. EB103A]|uniref:tetratricopeptide repeat protein n=1 Tax=Streptacidiphilus sp. EB103A TaxID=3156275 RepID=UPI0035113175